MTIRNLSALTILFVVCLLVPVPAAGSEIYVPDDYATIQSAIDATVDGDTVIVRPGTYPETIDFLGRDIVVQSLEGPETTIIEGRVRFISDETRSTVLDGFTVQNAPPDYSGIYCNGCSPTIRNNIIKGHSNSGIAAYNDECSPMILNNVIRDNTTDNLGGGLSTYMSQPVVLGNSFINNHCITDQGFTGGGAMCVGWYFSDLVIVGNEFIGNTASEWGGAILCVYPPSSVVVTNNTFIGNSAHEGGVIYCTEPYSGGSPVDGLIPMVFANNLFDGNTADWGPVLANGTYFDLDFHNCTFVGNGESTLLSGANTIVNSIFWNNGGEAATGSPDITWSIVEGGWPGTGNIDADPLFVAGPNGDYYLSQIAAGQTADSPGVNSGSDQADQTCYPIYEAQVCMNQFTTRTDLETDDGQVDMGYHYPDIPIPSSPFIAAGLGPHPANPTLVHLLPPLQDATPLLEFSAYSVSKYGVNVACGDMTGTGADTILTGPGPGAMFGPHVRGFSSDGIQLPGLSVLAYGTNKYGVNVAAGDFDNDGIDEILTGAGPGDVFGPHVRAFDYDGGPAVTPMPGVSFMAYGASKWGVNVAAGDLDGDGYDEIVTGAGPGTAFGPHVRGWNVDGGTVASIPGIGFMAYGTPRYGVVVSCGDVNGDGIDEIITAPGPSPAFGSHIRGWNYDGSTISELPGLSFFAWPAAEVRYGARVWAGSDLDLDSRDELIVGRGPGPENGSLVKVYTYQNDQLTLDFTLGTFPPVYTHGVNVAAGRF